MKRNEIDEALQLEDRETFVHHHRNAIAALLQRGKLKLTARRTKAGAGNTRDQQDRNEKRRIDAHVFRHAHARA